MFARITATNFADGLLARQAKVLTQNIPLCLQAHCFIMLCKQWLNRQPSSTPCEGRSCLFGEESHGRLCLLSKVCMRHLANHCPERRQREAVEPGISLQDHARWCSHVPIVVVAWGVEPAAPRAVCPAAWPGTERCYSSALRVCVPRTGRAELEFRQL